MDFLQILYIEEFIYENPHICEDFHIYEDIIRLIQEGDAMIVYTPLWNTLEEKGISTYKLEHKYGMSKAMIHKLKHNQSITMITLNQLCQMFQCDITDVIKYIED